MAAIERTGTDLRSLASPSTAGLSEAPRLDLAQVRARVLAGRCQLWLSGIVDGERLEGLFVFAFSPRKPERLGTVAVMGFQAKARRARGFRWMRLGTLQPEDLWIEPEMTPSRGEWTESEARPYRALAQRLLKCVASSQATSLPRGFKAQQLPLCARCLRPLRDPESLNRGIGPECFDIIQNIPAVRALMAILARATDDEVRLAWEEGVQAMMALLGTPPEQAPHIVGN